MATTLECMIARYRTVLIVPGAFRLFATTLFARLPQGMGTLAVLLVVRGATHSYALAGLATGGQALASAAATPLQGRLVDRLGRGWVLMPCAVLQAAFFVALVVGARDHVPGGVLVVLACGTGAFQPAIAPAMRALLRSVIRDPGVRETAYALESVAQELIWMSGPLLVAAVVTATSPATAALLCAAVTIVGSTAFVTSPASRTRTRSPGGGRAAAVLRTHPELRDLLVPIALMGLAIGATEVGIPSLALHAGSRGDTGLLLAVWSAGSMIGGLVYGAASWQLPLAERYRRLLMLAVLCAVPLTLAHSIAFGLVGSLFTGLTIAPVFSCQYALIGRVVRDGSETEAFTWVSAALVAGLAAGSAIGGAVIGAVGVSAPFVVACLALAAAATTSVRARQLARVAA
jgi:predicted MFS family arabinose efflux permease